MAKPELHNARRGDAVYLLTAPGGKVSRVCASRHDAEAALRKCVAESQKRGESTDWFIDAWVVS